MFQCSTSFVDHLCYLCLVFVMLLIAALWSHEGKGLTSWPLFVIFIVIVLLYFPICYTGAGLVLDCIDARSLVYFLLYIHLVLQSY